MSSDTTQTQTVQVCPTSAQWLQWLSEREAGDLFATRADLADHAESCAACKTAVAEVRRFQTLLLRGKPAPLSQEQRQSLEGRIALQAGVWTPPNRARPWLVWGLASSAAAAVALLVAQPFGRTHSGPTFAEAVKAAAVPTADNPGPGVAVATVDGDVQVAGANGQWAPLKPGAALRFGMRLRAANGGRVVASGRFELSLLPQSEVETLAMSGTTAFFRVRRGEIECQVDKLHAGERFAVMFGAFRASVVGTRFAVRQDGAGAEGRVTVTEGAVRVDSADDPAAPAAETTTVVRAGHRWRHGGGVMSLEPVPAAEPAQAPAQAMPAAVSAPVAPLAQLPAAPAETPAIAEPVAADGAKPAVGAHVHKSGHATAEEPPLVNVQQGPQVGPRQIIIEVPHQTMQPQDANAPDAKQK